MEGFLASLGTMALILLFVLGFRACDERLDRSNERIRLEAPEACRQKCKNYGKPIVNPTALTCECLMN